MTKKGKLVWETHLDIYGKVRTFAGRSLSDCPFRYQGQYEDAETGLYYNRFRYYSPEEGIYLSQDPIGLAGNNPTLYGYVKDVNSWIDSSGLDGKSKVFWSGGKRAREAAEAYAKSVDGEILEMTAQGKALEKWTDEMDWETQAKPLWEKTSQDFAGSAPNKQKHALVFIDSSKYRGVDSVWEKFEKPILAKKGITTEVIDVNKKVKCY
jgi:RHS repeat-associated protein